MKLIGLVGNISHEINKFSLNLVYLRLHAVYDCQH